MPQPSLAGPRATPSPARVIRLLLVATLLLAQALAAPLLAAPAPDLPAPSLAGGLGTTPAQREAGYWIARQKGAETVVLPAAAIAERNARALRNDPSLNDLAALPPMLDGERVRAWVEARSARPTRTLYDASGKQGTARQLDKLVVTLDLRSIPEMQVTRFGLVTRRASLRTFPSSLRVFHAPGDTDIDRFQESALFPGTPVAIAHSSRDGKWLFVVSPTYAAWIAADAVAEGSREQVLGYATRTPHLVVTGAGVRTAFTPGLGQVSKLPLDMGVRLPLLADWPSDQLVHGQHPGSAHVVELPTRQADGALALVPALIPLAEDARPGALPLTRAHVLRQAFKFLGERYGWGHDYEARDCSGFVAEVYRSFGLVLPRNTGDQATSAALETLPFTDADDRARRLAVLGTLRAGDLVYVPGHVMMIVGHAGGVPHVIHDTAAVSFMDPQRGFIRQPVNAVVVTPLLPLQFDATHALVDRITAIQRLRPTPIAAVDR